MTTTVYEIRDYAYEPGWVHTEDIQRFGASTPPKKFESKLEAKPYLNALKAARLKTWTKDGYLDQARGRCRPAWKIYAAL